MLRFFENTNLVAHLPDAYNYKPYWWVAPVTLPAAMASPDALLQGRGALPVAMTCASCNLADTRCHWLCRGNTDGTARIVHFHGPKPDRCVQCYLDMARGRNGTTAPCSCPYYDRLWWKAIDADGGEFYAELQQQFQQYRQAASLENDSS